jgi:hypothetical protein
MCSSRTALKRGVKEERNWGPWRQLPFSRKDERAKGGENKGKERRRDWQTVSVQSTCTFCSDKGVQEVEDVSLPWEETWGGQMN